MAIAFPSNPVNGEEFIAAGRRFRYTSPPGVWESIGSTPSPETDPVFSASVSSGITSLDIANWGEAYSWGDHALAGYVTSTNGSDFYYVQPTQPVSPSEGDMWYNTLTEDLLVYRETSTNVFNWVPLSTGEGNSDTLDGGAY